MAARTGDGLSVARAVIAPYTTAVRVSVIATALPVKNSILQTIYATSTGTCCRRCSSLCRCHAGRAKPSIATPLPAALGAPLRGPPLDLWELWRLFVVQSAIAWTVPPFAWPHVAGALGATQFCCTAGHFTAPRPATTNLAGRRPICPPRFKLKWVFPPANTRNASSIFARTVPVGGSRKSAFMARSMLKRSAKQDVESSSGAAHSLSTT